MQRILTATLLVLALSTTANAMANPANINSAEGGYHNPVMIYNNSNQQIGFQFGRFPDEQMIYSIVAPHSSTIFRAQLKHRKLHLFVYYRIPSATGLNFSSDFKTYNTYKIKSITVTDPTKGYVVTCLDGGTESCVTH